MAGLAISKRVVKTAFAVWLSFVLLLLIRGTSLKEEEASSIRMPLMIQEAERMPFRIYDSFVRKHDNCAIVTIVAQYEGYCEDMLNLLSLAAEESYDGNATAWLEAAVAKPGQCAVCVLNAWERKESRRLDALKKERLHELGFPATSGLRCIFQDHIEIEAAVPHPSFAKGASTLIIECPVPTELQSLACDKRHDLKLEVKQNNERSTLPFDVPLVELPSKKVTIATCTWISSTTFRDRGGDQKSIDPIALREWLAAHSVMGVSYFALFESDAKWTKPQDSIFWSTLAPLVRAELASLFPWPRPACGARGDGPWVKLKGSQRVALSVQDFFGRPTQYAAQNSCHRRLIKFADYILHIDIDEFALPGSGHTSLLSVLNSLQSRIKPQPLASLSLPHLFYGPCPSHGRASSSSISGLLFSLPKHCAGKAQASRIKQLASTEHVLYIWDHYVRASKPKSSALTANALHDIRLAHARSGYTFTGPATARSASVLTNERATPKMWDTFRQTILPRLDSLECHLANDSSFCGGGSTDPFCWCRDSATINYWAARVKKQQRAWWPSSV